MKYLETESDIHILARALLRDGDKIVLCRVKGKSWFFLPGGHVENGETAEAALVRELTEEIGSGEYRVRGFLGVCENFFTHDEETVQQELNLVFEVEMQSSEALSQEGHIEFVAIAAGELADCKLLPDHLKQGLTTTLQSGRPFYTKLELEKLDKE